MANAISWQYIIPVLLPAAGTLSMSIIVLKKNFTGEGAPQIPPRTPPPHCYGNRTFRPLDVSPLHWTFRHQDVSPLDVSPPTADVSPPSALHVVVVF